MKSKKITLFLAIITFIVSAMLTIALLAHLYPQSYREYVEKYSEEYGIEKELVYAIIKCESNFKQDSKSHVGAIGLMQITPDTFEWAAQKAGEKNLSASSLLDAETNIKYGCYIYSIFYGEFKDQNVALASYNAGRGNVLSWLNDKRYSEDGILLNDIPFEETKKYVKKVENVRKIYEFIY